MSRRVNYTISAGCLNCTDGGDVEHVTASKQMPSQASAVYRCTRCGREHHMLNVLRLMSEVR